MRKFIASLVLTVAAFGGAATAFAGAPKPWQFGFQEAATPVMERIVSFHNMLLVITIGIAVFVTGLLFYVMVKFSEKNNPVPSKTTHHTGLEVIWTIVPIIILVVIAVPSFKLLYFMDRTGTPEMTIKVTGSQWLWSYEYPDHGKFVFDSQMIPDEELKPGQIRLLEVDNRVVVPVDTNIRVLVTANAVIHSWAVPALGIKIDSVPGRMNETWMRIIRPGVYYGQCSELCGINHAFMPIAVEAVSKADFEKWLGKAKVEFKAENSLQEVEPKLKLAGIATGAARGE